MKNIRNLIVEYTSSRAELETLSDYLLDLRNKYVSKGGHLELHNKYNEIHQFKYHLEIFYF